METMKINQYGDQIPVLISFVSNNIREVILIDHTKFVYLEYGELDMACVEELVIEMFIKLLNLLKQYENISFTILVHNLGGFDGLYLFKYLTKVLGFEVDALIDNNNKFIQITQIKIKWIDSYRLFPIKLDDLLKKSI